MLSSDKSDQFISVNPKRRLLKVVGAVMALAVVAFLGFLALSSSGASVEEI